jgi:hypothetical protein
MDNKEEILSYLTSKREYKITSEGTSPYWYYTLRDENENVHIAIWFSKNNKGHRMEISELIEGSYIFNGHVYDLYDIKYVFLLTFDCIDKNGYLFDKKPVFND